VSWIVSLRRSNLQYGMKWRSARGEDIVLESTVDCVSSGNALGRRVLCLREAWDDQQTEREKVDAKHEAS
jgi:hypothetical protein